MIINKRGPSGKVKEIEQYRRTISENELKHQCLYVHLVVLHAIQNNIRFNRGVTEYQIWFKHA